MSKAEKIALLAKIQRNRTFIESMIEDLIIATDTQNLFYTLEALDDLDANLDVESDDVQDEFLDPYFPAAKTEYSLNGGSTWYPWESNNTALLGKGESLVIKHTSDDGTVNYWNIEAEVSEVNESKKVPLPKLLVIGATFVVSFAVGYAVGFVLTLFGK